MKRFSFFMTFLVVLVLIAPTAFAAGVVKFGAVEIRSGAFKSTGDRFIQAITAAIKEANETGGVLGKKIELVVEDNQMKGEIAVQKLKKLIMKEDVKVIIQGSSSSVGGAIAQQMPRYKRIYLNVGAEAVGITGKNFNPYVFRTCLNAAMHVKALAQYFGTKTSLRKVFLINQDYSWGHDVAIFYEKFIKEIAPDTQIVGKEFHPVYNKDFAPYISKILASGADYVITGNWGIDLAQVIVQGRKLGVKIPYGVCFIDFDEIARIAGDASLGVIQANSYLLGVDSPQAKAWEEAYHKSTKDQWPNYVSHNAYLGVKMYIEAVKKAGTFDTEAVIKAFEGLKFEGPTGTVWMRKEDHQIQTPVVIGEVVKESKYFDFPYVKPFQIIPAEKASVSLQDSGWKPWKK